MSNHNYFSTEFTGKVFLQIAIFWGMVHGFFPPNVSLIVMASLSGLYMILRTIHKIKTGQDLPDLPTLPTPQS